MIHMKRITISLDDRLYYSLVDYAADGSKRHMSRLSVSKAIRDLLSAQLSQMGYHTVSEAATGRAKRLESSKEIMP